MNTCFTLRRASMILALTLPSLCWGFSPHTALVVDDGTSFDISYVEAYLTSRLQNAGYTVTTNTGVPSGPLNYTQVWDVRFDNIAPLSSSDITTYLSYLNAGGSLFVMGENVGYLTRDNSIPPLITAAGGGTVAVLQTGNSLNLQTIQSPFTGPESLSTVTFAAIGGFASIGNAHNLSLDANNVAGGIVFPPGTLSNDPLGTLIVILDVNFLTSGVGGSQALTDNLISYLAAQSSISLSTTPAPPTLLLVLLGLGGALLYSARTMLRRA